MKIIAFDTEFERRRTYLPILSIIQIKENNKIIIADCFKDENSELLKRIKELLENESAIKIIHSASQDMEAIYWYFKIIPKNIFDTQIAAKYLFKNEASSQMGYNTLLKKILNIEINKDLQKSNWLKRPLSEEQIKYAKEDVEYLIEVFNYFKLNLSLEEMKQIFEESKKLTDVNLYAFSPDNFWNKNKYYKLKLPLENIDKLKKLMNWREKKAFYKNLPRQFIIPNQILVAIVSGRIEEYENSRSFERYKKEIEEIIR